MSENKPKILAAAEDEFKMVQKVLSEMPLHLYNMVGKAERLFGRDNAIVCDMHRIYEKEIHIEVPRSLIHSIKTYEEENVFRTYIYCRDFVLKFEHILETRFSYAFYDETTN